VVVGVLPLTTHYSPNLEQCGPHGGPSELQAVGNEEEDWVRGLAGTLSSRRSFLLAHSGHSTAFSKVCSHFWHSYS
jgi:hypothetical protein